MSLVKKCRVCETEGECPKYSGNHSTMQKLCEGLTGLPFCYKKGACLETPHANEWKECPPSVTPWCKERAVPIRALAQVDAHFVLGSANPSVRVCSPSQRPESHCFSLLLSEFLEYQSIYEGGVFF